MTSPRALRSIIGIAALSVLAWFVPLVRVTPLAAGGRAPSPEEFHAAETAERLWTSALVPSMDRAPEAQEALAAIEADPSAAREKLGRTIGVSRGFMLCLKGEGRILSVDRTGIGVALDSDDQADILLQTGPIFGSAVRDATGVIASKDFPSSQDFNALAAELNRIVEERVAAPLAASAKPGMLVRFTGCAEVKDPIRMARPLKVAPVSIELE